MITKKENLTDGFIKLDNGKPRFNFTSGLFPTVGHATLGVEAVLEYGATKYARDNWKLGGSTEDITRNVNAAIRHLSAYLDGRSLDDESGLPHLAHAAADILFALHHELNKKNQVYQYELFET